MSDEICTSKTRGGQGCTRPAVPGTDKCGLHLPATTEAMRHAGARGGKRSGATRARRAAQRAELKLLDEGALIKSGLDLSTVAGMRAALDHALALVLRDLPHAAQRANAIGALVSRAIEVQREVANETELEELRAQVEQVVEGRRRRRLPGDAPALEQKSEDDDDDEGTGEPQ